MGASNETLCIGCGDRLPAERVELGYAYCTKDDCQARFHRGVKIVAIGVNKSSDVYLVADEDELKKRADSGEFARKDTTLGVGYRSPARVPASAPRAATAAGRAGGNVTRPWSSEQEKIVRLYHDMGLRPAQIVERAARNTPQLRITGRLVTQILSAPPADQTRRSPSARRRGGAGP
jgi:hypothetical protein